MITLQQVTKRFGRYPALREVSLQVTTGTRTAVLGPNGSGKSTMLRLAAGLTPPSSGTVQIDGVEPRRSKPDIGFAGNRSYLYPYLSARENLRFYADLYLTDRHRIDDVLELMSLEHKGSNHVHTFSKGETQRLSLARALLHSPGHLILDEPFSGLDDASAETLLEHLRVSGQTVLMATHDPARAERLADSIVKLDAGRLQ